MAEGPVMAVVKANAYGHGWKPWRKRFPKWGGLAAVARFEKPRNCAKPGLRRIHMVLGYTTAMGDSRGGRSHRLTSLTVETARAYSQLVSQRGWC
jgi:alanine racemase